MIVDCVKGVVKVGADVMEGVGDGLLVVERAGVGVLGSMVVDGVAFLIGVVVRLSEGVVEDVVDVVDVEVTVVEDVVEGVGDVLVKGVVEGVRDDEDEGVGEV